MHRFFIDYSARPGERVRFPAAAARQMARVLRLMPGDRVVAVDPDGWELTVVLDRVDPRQAEGEVTARERRETEPPLRVILAQGLPKGDKMDLVVQKCTEVGVAAILPVVTRRTVVDLEGKEEERRRRWQRIAQEAAEQAGRARVPEILPITPFGQAVANLAGADLFLIPWEEERSRGLRRVLREVTPRLADGGAAVAAGGAAARCTVAVLVGPEGGLAAEEVALACRRGAQPVTLGPRLLRTETAGLVVLAAVLYELGDLG